MTRDEKFLLVWMLIGWVADTDIGDRNKAMSRLIDRKLVHAGRSPFIRYGQRRYNQYRLTALGRTVAARISRTYRKPVKAGYTTWNRHGPKHRVSGLRRKSDIYGNLIYDNYSNDR